MERKNVDVAKVVPSESNLNSMSRDEYASLVKAIKTVGFLQPILVRKGSDGYQLIDGHHRHQAAKELGFNMVPAVILDEKEEVPNEVISVMMNRIRGNVDLAGVAVLADDLLDSGWEIEELEIMGFSNEELTDLIDAANDTTMPEDLAAAPPPEDDPLDVTKPFLLEIMFRTREEVKMAKKALKKAAGKGGDLATGLMRLIGEE